MIASGIDAHVVVDREGFRLDASMAADPGEVVAIVGPSGAGKSTLLAALAGLVRPARGSIRIGGRLVDEAGRRRAHVAPARRGVVLLGQEPRLFPHLSAAENVAFSMRARGHDRRESREAAEAWLDRVGLTGMARRSPADLSGGQQQRVAIARALAAAPRAVLLDEPLTALDAETAAELRAVLAEQLAAHRTTAVLVTHDAVDAAALAKRLMVLEDGRVTQFGPVRDVLSRPATRFVATVAGLTLLVGTARDGAWVDAGGRLTLKPQDADSARAVGVESAAVAAVVPPSAVRLQPRGHGRRAEHSERGRDTGEVWSGRITRLEATIGGVRAIVRVSDGLPGARLPDAHDDTALTLAAEVPAMIAAELRLRAGLEVIMDIDTRDVRLFRR